VLTKRLSFLAALVTLLHCLSGVSLDGLRSNWLATVITVLPPLLGVLVALVDLRQRVPSPPAELAQLRATKSRARTKCVAHGPPCHAFFFFISPGVVAEKWSGRTVREMGA
jgi:hypothetical protein